ncbi:MAG: DNA polymerase III subunit delta [Anaerolineae bacterium]|nr:DNA polymerase III subunit delta [Anaerolineae bacterium]
MITLIHGDEEFLRAEALQGVKAALGPSEMADLNTTHLDGRKVTLGELRQTCDTVPFLSTRRLVVVDSLLDRLAGEKGPTKAQDAYLQELIGYLDQVPESTELVFVEAQTVSHGHPLLRRIQELAQDRRARVMLCQRKRRDDLVNWIETRARARGGQITRDGTYELINTVGDNLRLLDQELQKLIAYTAGQRAIGREDVRLLVPEAAEANIFQMVDALGQGNGRRAIVLLHQLLDEGAAPLYLLSMIVRQYRLLLQVKELIAQGLRPSAIASELKLRDFVVEKMTGQARRYSLPQLEAIYERLLETDLAIKTGQMEPVMAMDVLVAELSG